MSSSNLVRVAVIEESAYGVTPGSGNFKTARFTDEALSGTPETVESQQIRTDRMSSGQIVTGLTVGGQLSFELAKEDVLELFMASAMNSSWDVKSQTTVDLEIDATAKTIERASGNWNSDAYKVGDFCTLSGFVATGNNVPIMIAEIVSNTVIRYVGPSGMSDETGSGTAIKRADKLTIGTTKKSFSMEKKFLDLTTKGINYRGMLVNSMELNVAYGALVTGNFELQGNDYVTANSSGELITNSRTVDAPATSQTLNGSIDMPFLANSASGDLDATSIAIRSVNLKLNNNNSPQNVIGDTAPINYSLGTAAIEVSLNAYNNDESWDMLEQKLNQTPFSLAFQVKNADGWYGFYLPAVQVSFDDPASGGRDQDIELEMKGTAKVGAAGESSISIFRSA